MSDPYRWLEGTDDPETVAWVRAENQLTEAFLAAVPTREEIRSRLTDLLDYPKFGVPFERGGVWFETRNPGLQDQPVLWVMEEPGSDGRVLLDPNVLSPDGTVAVTGIEVSEDGSKVAYATSAGGSDWKIWRVREVATASDLDDVIEWSKFSPVAWRKDGSGFYYAAMEPPPEGAEYLDESRLERIFFHRLGAGQADDELVFSTPDQIEWLLAPAVTDDGRFLVISIHRGTFPEAQVHVLDLEDPEAGFRSLVSDFASKAVVLTNVGTTFFLLTDDSADLQRDRGRRSRPTGTGGVAGSGTRRTRPAPRGVRLRRPARLPLPPARLFGAARLRARRDPRARHPDPRHDVGLEQPLRWQGHRGPRHQ